MNAYNIAVTVGPNIFRPETIRPADLINAGTYYDAVIRMIENFDVIFNDSTTQKNGTFDLLAQTQEMEDSAVT